MKRWMVLALLIGMSTPVDAGNSRIRVEKIALAPSVCSGQFIEHTLDHTTHPYAETIRTFDSNGSGVALNDLDGDSQVDIVLA
ncbi:MAG: CRTAC1 family protein, partial [Chloroflexi bacterium]|nr:CRTAC1 family protein [Chloroflexota bacterium]